MRLWTVMAFVVGLALAQPAAAADVDFGYVPSPEEGEQPALLVTPQRKVAELYVHIRAGGKEYVHEKKNLPAGKQVRLGWTRDTSVTEADCFVRAVFPDGYVAEFNIPVSYSYSAALSVDLSRALADVKDRTLKVKVTAEVERADVIAYGAGKAVLDQRTIDISDGPGTITVPWVGDPEDVVLLDVTLHGANAWAGFTYSPWFLDIPHEDVLFDSNMAEINADQEWKLESTLRQLEDVLAKYGDLVPVKLYIAGCTDTAGDAGSNKDLSLRRARAIASWLRGHGYGAPIFYYGFGEALLAERTGDGVDNAANRRALYMVGANPPPAGSGVPSVSWRAL